MFLWMSLKSLKNVSKVTAVLFLLLLSFFVTKLLPPKIPVA